MVLAKDGFYCLCPLSMLGAFFKYPSLHPLFPSGSHTLFSFLLACP